MRLHDQLKGEARIIILFFTVLFSAFLGLSWIQESTLTLNEKISNSILLLTCASGIMATIFFVGNYITVRQSFIKSLEPALLMAVTPEKINVIEQGKKVTRRTDRTLIRYENPTNNVFTDLNIKIKIHANNQDYDHSYLFSKDMYMGPHDKRIRGTKLIEEAMKQGLDIPQTSRSGNEVKLLLSFSYTFNGEKKTHNIQEYIYKPDINYWDII